MLCEQRRNCLVAWPRRLHQRDHPEFGLSAENQEAFPTASVFGQDRPSDNLGSV